MIPLKYARTNCKETPKPETSDLQGNVFFKDEDLVWFGDEFTYNYLSKMGVLKPINLKMNDRILRAETMLQIGSNTYQIGHMKLTGCRWETPLYHLYAREASLQDNELVEASHLWVKWGDIPVFYLPVLATIIELFILKSTGRISKSFRYIF